MVRIDDRCRYLRRDVGRGLGRIDGEGGGQRPRPLEMRPKPSRRDMMPSFFLAALKVFDVPCRHRRLHLRRFLRRPASRPGEAKPFLYWLSRLGAFAAPSIQRLLRPPAGTTMKRATYQLFPKENSPIGPP